MGAVRCSGDPGAGGSAPSCDADATSCLPGDKCCPAIEKLREPPKKSCVASTPIVGCNSSGCAGCPQPPNSVSVCNAVHFRAARRRRRAAAPFRSAPSVTSSETRYPTPRAGGAHLCPSLRDESDRFGFTQWQQRGQRASDAPPSEIRMCDGFAVDVRSGSYAEYPKRRAILRAPEPACRARGSTGNGTNWLVRRYFPLDDVVNLRRASPAWLRPYRSSSNFPRERRANEDVLDKSSDERSLRFGGRGWNSWP